MEDKKAVVGLDMVQKKQIFLEVVEWPIILEEKELKNIFLKDLKF